MSNLSRWFILVVILASVVSLVGSGAAVSVVRSQGYVYNFGTSFLEGSAAHPAAHGTSTFEARKDGSVLKLQLEDAPELAGATLELSIDGTTVGDLRLDGEGNGTLTVRVKPGQPFPEVEGSTIEAKAPDGSLVASGMF